MTKTRPKPARRAWVAAAISAVLLASSCAQMPSQSPVLSGGREIVAQDDVGIIAAGPVAGLAPDAIVQGFILAAQAGPTTLTPFSVAKEYLTQQAAAQWRPNAQVIVLDETPTLRVAESESPDFVRVYAAGNQVAALDEHGNYAELPEPLPVEFAFTVEQIDGEWRINYLDDGMVLPQQVFASAFHETRLYFASHDLRFWVPDVRWFPQQTWRTNAVHELFNGPPPWLAQTVVSGVPQGAMLALDAVTQDEAGNIQVQVTDRVAGASAAQRGLLGAQLRATLASGSPSADVVVSDRSGPISIPEITLPQLARTNGDALALWVAAQVSDPQTSGSGEALEGEDAAGEDEADDDAVPDSELLPAADGTATGEIVQDQVDGELDGSDSRDDGRLWRVSGTELLPLSGGGALRGFDPTALAVPPGREGEIVIRDGMNRLLRIVTASSTAPADSGEEVLSVEELLGEQVPTLAGGPGIASPTGEPAQTETEIGLDDSDAAPSEEQPESVEQLAPGVTELLVGADLIAPSIDQYGVVWSGPAAESLQAVVPGDVVYTITAPWLVGRRINSVRVAPDGVRIAIVSTPLNESGEPDGEAIIEVAGIYRDDQNAPMALANDPKRVGSSLRGVTSAVWQGETTLAVVAEAGATQGIYWVGVGGLDTPGGLPQLIPGLSDPIALTASVGTGNMLALDSDEVLHLRQASSLWPTVTGAVALVAYPG